MFSGWFSQSWNIIFADKYLLRLKPDSSFVQGEGSRFSNDNDNGFISDVNSFGYHPLAEESPSLSSASEPPQVLDPTLDGSKRSMSSISTLKDLVRLNWLNIVSLCLCHCLNDTHTRFESLSCHKSILFYFCLQCMMEDLDVTFQPQPPSSANPLQKNEVHAQVYLFILRVKFGMLCSWVLLYHLYFQVRRTCLAIFLFPLWQA